MMDTLTQIQRKAWEHNQDLIELAQHKAARCVRAWAQAKGWSEEDLKMVLESLGLDQS